MGTTLSKLTGRDNYYFIILCAVFAKDFAYVIRRRSMPSRIAAPAGSNVLAYINYFLNNGGLIRTLLADAFGLIILWRILQFSYQIHFFFMKLNFSQQKESIMQFFFDWIKNLPFVQSKLEKEREKLEMDVRKSVKHSDHVVEKIYVLPNEGRSTEDILQEMKTYINLEDKQWEEGYISGAVYHGEREHLKCQNEALAMYSLSNPLHPEIWPSLRKFEAEIISMTASFLNGGDKNVCGAITSGGTESIMMAVKTHREWGRKVKGITQPEMIIPATAHAAFDKAADCLCIKLIKLPVDQTTFVVDPKLVNEYVTNNTIMIVGSAPNYPQGTIDPIQQLSTIAIANNIGLHVDCCLGGFVLPFGKGYNNNEFQIPEFDFSLKGVTSMSCDTHKYGYAAKGTSVVLYRDKKLRSHQYWCYSDWTGGIYATPTYAGSRAGGLIAACWASMIRMGRVGYEKATYEILKTRQYIQNRIDEEIEELFILGDPKAMVVSWGSKKLNIYVLSDKMGKLGWSVNSLQRPASAHLCVTYRQTLDGVKERFIDDLKKCVKLVLEDDKGKNVVPEDGKAPIYGTIASLPPGPVNDLICTYMDVVLEV